MCFLCEEEETIGHLLLHCHSARQLWDILLEIVGIHWVFLLTVLQALLSWQGAPIGKKHKKFWLAIPFCLFWTLWLERNMVAFENEAFGANRMKVSFLSDLWFVE